MSDKKRILHAITRMAKQLRRPPSRAEFLSTSGITLATLLKTFSTWNRALRAAGFRPHTLNMDIDDARLLEDWGKIARRNKAMLKRSGKLSRDTYRLQGKYCSQALAYRFGGWSFVPRAFRKFARGKPGWRDVLALLPANMSPWLSPRHRRARQNFRTGGK
jgi:hypothetical protein